jgi:heat shock protein HslJ
MSKTWSRPIYKALLLVLTLTLGACAQVMPTCSAVNSPPVRDLAGTQWELIRWHYTSPNDGKTRQRGIPHSGNGTAISLNISANGQTASGSTGCNNFTGQIISSDWGLVLDKVASTRKACSSNLAELETKFLNYLSNYRTMVRDGDRLIIMTRDGEVLSFSQKN